MTQSGRVLEDKALRITVLQKGDAAELTNAEDDVPVSVCDNDARRSRSLRERSNRNEDLSRTCLYGSPS